MSANVKLSGGSCRGCFRYSVTATRYFWINVEIMASNLQHYVRFGHVVPHHVMFFAALRHESHKSLPSVITHEWYVQ